MAAFGSIKILVTHLGFTPDDPAKRAVITGYPVHGPIPFRVVAVSGRPYRTAFEGMAQPFKGDFGTAHIAPFGKLKQPGMYQVVAGDAGAEELEYLVDEPRDPQVSGPPSSVPFWVRDDLYYKPLKMAIGYYPAQRSGVDVPGCHVASHLDDGIRNDNGARLDAVGGWYDGGNLKKGIWPTCLSAYALAQLAEKLQPDFPSAETKRGAVIAELQFILPFLLKMQDRTTGIVFMDIGAGEEIEADDNRWTDNKRGKDDRMIRTEYDPWVQGMFMAAMAKMSTVLPRKPDRGKALRAAVKCADALPEFIEPEIIAQAATIIGLYEISNAGVENAAELKAQMEKLGERMLELQETRPTGSVTGFFLSDERRDDFHRHHALSGLPMVALGFLARASSGRKTSRWRQALSRYLHNTLFPLTEKNAYGLLPYGLYRGSPLGEMRRELGAGLSYRYFMSPYRDLLRHRPVRKFGIEHGLNGHLLSMAVGLVYAGEVLTQKGGREKCRAVAEDQLRWVLGFNPLNISFMTGLGWNNPFPHSPFAGQLPGAIMNGTIGGRDDLPWTDTDALMDWRTCDYWQVHNAWFTWFVSIFQESRLSPAGRKKIKSIGTV